MTGFSSQSFDRLRDAVVTRATHRHSALHGEPHWRTVTHTALELAPHVPGADPLVGFLFGLLHDSQRLDDGADPEHGPRAARLTQRLFDEDLLPISPAQLTLLARAIRHHTTGRWTDEPTVAICWDADRLNLWRINVRPDPQFLSTAAAKDPATIAAHRKLPGQHTLWNELYDRLTQLEIA